MLKTILIIVAPTLIMFILLFLVEMSDKRRKG